jgi:hypothetical protein
LSKIRTCEALTSPLTHRNRKEDCVNRAGTILFATNKLPLEEVTQQESVAASIDQKTGSQNDSSAMERHAILNTGSAQVAKLDQTSQDAMESYDDSSQTLTSFDKRCKHDEDAYYMMSNPRLAKRFSSTATANSISDSCSEDSDDSDLPSVFTETVHPARNSEMDIDKPYGETKVVLKGAATQIKDKCTSRSGKDRHYQAAANYDLDHLVQRKLSEVCCLEFLTEHCWFCFYVLHRQSLQYF